MDQPKPEYLRPALIAGAVAGLLSGLPFIGAGNCICCLWIIGGGAIAVKMLAGQTAGLLTSGDGAIVGALTGIVAAVVDTVAKLAFRGYNMELAQRIVGSLDLDSGMPAGLEGLFDGATGALTPGWMLIGLFISAAVYAAFGSIGGVIGVSLFGRKAVPPVPPPPAAPPQGPSDAA